MVKRTGRHTWIAIPGMSSVISDRTNLITLEGESARLKVMAAIMRIGGKAPVTLA
jgi:hypothetical protein